MTLSIRRNLTLAGAFAVAIAAPLSAHVVKPATIQERAHGAQRVVVASISQTNARYERNQYGDNLIVTHATLNVEENIKGKGGAATVAVEGGTVNGVTLHVSSLPMMAPGDRAVFFLNPTANGEYLPYLRGQGILKLDATNHVRGSSLTVDDIRRMSQGQ